MNNIRTASGAIMFMMGCGLQLTGLYLVGFTLMAIGAILFYPATQYKNSQLKIVKLASPHAVRSFKRLKVFIFVSIAVISLGFAAIPQSCPPWVVMVLLELIALTIGIVGYFWLRKIRNRNSNDKG